MRLVATSIVTLEVFFLKLKLFTLTGKAGGFCHAEATNNQAPADAGASNSSLIPMDSYDLYDQTARFTLPDLRQRVQTLALLTLPSSSILTV